MSKPVTDRRSHAALRAAHKDLGWPSPERILQPDSAVSQMWARLARQKVGGAVRRAAPALDMDVGVLVSDPEGENQAELLALVCVFARPIGNNVLSTLLDVAWNFSRAPLCITIEPQEVRGWSCWEPPPGQERPRSPVTQTPWDPQSDDYPDRDTARTLHWVTLASGEIFEHNAHRFRRERRADRLLLENLKQVRRLLRTGAESRPALPDDVIHDLLARLIFIQFLLQRRGQAGEAALDAETLRRIFDIRSAEPTPDTLAAVLRSKQSTYKLFHYLNDRFNGDLFPGCGDTPEVREQEWRQEMDRVQPSHLQLLADFASGELELADGQRCLWPVYSFDAIPLEFISTIYEEFVRNAEGSQGAHYTPGHLVDFLLDGILPWAGNEWDLRILDPACGSGVFLVKAFQRLVQRWRNAHPGEEPHPESLTRLLRNNIFGVDIHPQAIRVASFSLYLALCDELEPRRLWEKLRFPKLRGEALIVADFFDERQTGFQTHQDRHQFDCAVGNPPWGKQVPLTEAAIEWSRTFAWPIVNRELGTLFPAKCAHLVKPEGYVSVIQPAMPVLFNREQTATRWRERLFRTVTVTEVVNFGRYCDKLFTNAKSPCCLLTFSPAPPDPESINGIRYMTPKPAGTGADQCRFTLTPYDVATVQPREALEDPWVWSAFAWGGPRDLQLVHRLGDALPIENRPRLADFRSARTGWIGREGYKRGDRQLERHDLTGDDFPLVEQEMIEAFHLIGDLKRNQDPRFDRHKGRQDIRIFSAPLILLAKNWTVESGFRATMVDHNALYPASGAFGFHYPTDDRRLAEGICLLLNSRVANYFLNLTCGQMAVYKPQALTHDLLTLRIGDPDQLEAALEGRSLEDIVQAGDVEKVVRQWLGLKAAEGVLIDDFCDVSLPDRRQPRRQVGRQPPTEPQLKDFCTHLMKVLTASSGAARDLAATIYMERHRCSLVMRLVTIHLDWPGRPPVTIDDLSSEELYAELARLGRHGVGDPAAVGARGPLVTTIYRAMDLGDGVSIPTVYLLKPDHLRYWTRTMALRDGDRIASDLSHWGRRLLAGSAAEAGGVGVARE